MAKYKYPDMNIKVGTATIGMHFEKISSTKVTVGIESDFVKYECIKTTITINGSLRLLIMFELCSDII